MSPIKPKTFQNETQSLVYSRGLDVMRRLDETYREHVKAFGKKPHRRGVFKARLFGSNFCLCGMTLALGREGHQLSEEVYLALLKEASQGLRLSRTEMKDISVELLKEQSHALVQERNNVGSGQFSLAALYLAALKESVGPVDSAGEPFDEPLVSVIGRLVGETLAEWAGLHGRISGQAMQVYDKGFRPTPEDSRRLET